MALKIKIRTNILLHFLFILLSLSFVLIGVQYYFSEKMAREAINDTFHQTAEKIALTLEDKDRLSKEILYQLEDHPSVQFSVDAGLPFETIKHFIHTLKRYENMYAVYLGYGNGDFFEVINMHINQTIHRHYSAPPQTRWTVIKIYNTPQKRIREFIFLDKALHILSQREEPSSYHVTTRPWYQQAMNAEKPVCSAPYLFSNLKEKGITYSTKLTDRKTVLALDFTLQSMHHILRSLPYAQKGNIYLYGVDGLLISSSVKAQNRRKHQIEAMVKRGEINQLKAIQENGLKHFAMVIPLSSKFGGETYMGITADYSSIVTPYREKILYALAIALVLLLMFIPFTLYLTDHIVKPIKTLMAENEKIKARAFEQVEAVQTNIIELIELSDSQLTMSASIQKYQQQQEALLDAFIMLIADAIDAKSAYTGAHCKKVPVIATMLAKEADKNNTSAFKNFHFKNSEEWEAFERAAWLHDCGKITTPEYVVDKATKLETIYNRIHEIRTRFEVIWRDIEIDYYVRLLQGENSTELDTWKAKEQQRLLDDFAFIASCNLGAEFMSETKRKRIENIAKRTWLRHFDNHLGLAEEELARYDTPSSPLPAIEYLLYDGKEHLIERSNFDEKAYREQGFKMEVPQYLYNRGELYNLTLSKGTLTDEERFKINEHVIMTIKMLEQLPFPESMKAVPQIAGEHHENMDGTGYPRHLSREALSIPSRIMAIADIFEALTASDRPYKQAKTLSEALRIMYTMKKENHIDADLFDLFVRSGVYLDYAKSYLQESQIDEVDKESLLG